ncbi:hypothetical protein D9Q98_009012 [Chlorella vulgaris]|uniref:Uncharacterized protein n=1 Tax=Chlorella vulgaris TaxID=3077 RepID=A0A9D4YTL2_CHLVU|nr:hypothetical protein D9Q98_009012 [Chlorella vulgaris]
MAAAAAAAEAAAGVGSEGSPSSHPRQAARAHSVTSASEFDPAAITELRDSKQELIAKVQSMKQDLADWRSRMSQQVDSYREELTGLQASLSDEMSGLRGELAAMKARIKQQLDSNARLIGDMQRRDSREAATAASNVPAAVSVANTAQA